MMNRRNGYFFLLWLATAFCLTGCVTRDQEEKPSIPMMTISTGSVGAGHYNICSSIADWVNARLSGYPITAVPGSGGLGNPIRVGRGKADIGVSYGPFLIMAREGTQAPYTEKFSNLRSICSLISNSQHVLVAEEFDIKYLSDISREKIGLKLATGFPGSSDRFILKLALEEVGTTEENLRAWGGAFQQIGTSGRVSLWKDRHINAFHSSIEFPAAAVTEAMASRPGRLLSIRDSVRERLVDKFGFNKADIPAGTYPGQASPVATLQLTMVLFTTEAVDENAVYIFTRTIAESRERLQKSYGAFKDWVPENMVENLGIPIHGGALKYYRERGWL